MITLLLVKECIMMCVMFASIAEQKKKDMYVKISRDKGYQHLYNTMALKLEPK